MSTKIEFLELGVRKASAGWVAFHEFKVNTVPRIEEAEAVASEAVANRRLLELIVHAYEDADEEAKNAAYIPLIEFISRPYSRRTTRKKSTKTKKGTSTK